MRFEIPEVDLPGIYEHDIDLILQPYGELRMPFSSGIDSDMWTGFPVKSSAVYWLVTLKGRDDLGGSVNIKIDISLPPKPPVKIKYSDSSRCKCGAIETGNNHPHEKCRKPYFCICHP